jgi:hypothetical protein
VSRFKTILLVLVIADAAAFLLFRQHDKAKVREKDEAVRRQADRIAQLESENQRLSNLVVRATSSRTESASADSASSVSTSSESSRELLRLRGEVGLLRRQTNELGALLQDNDRLSKAMADSETQTNQFSPEDQLIVRQTHAVDATGALLGAIKKYSSNHDGQLPASLDQLIDFGATNLAGNLKFSDFIFGQDAGTDTRGKSVILRLKVPLPNPGGAGALMIVGGLDDAGVPYTSIWNVSP